ncbi:MAG: CDP-alcohol phosphatidyltransferase family protein [Pseudomonadota bacterium]
MSLKWLPNLLTIFRIMAAPIVGYGLWMTLASDAQQPDYQLWAISSALFAAAALTDALDGFLARYLGATSDLGAHLDLWADKLLVAAFFIGVWPGAPGLTIIGLSCFTLRDLVIMGLRRAFPEANLKATLLAKWKTGLLFLAITLFLVACLMALIDPASLSRRDAVPTSLLFMALVVGAVAAALSFYTGLQYAQATLRYRAS